MFLSQKLHILCLYETFKLTVANTYITSIEIFNKSWTVFIQHRYLMRENVAETLNYVKTFSINMQFLVKIIYNVWVPLNANLPLIWNLNSPSNHFITCFFHYCPTKTCEIVVDLGRVKSFISIFSGANDTVKNSC